MRKGMTLEEKKNIIRDVRAWVYESTDLNRIHDDELEEVIREQALLRLDEERVCPRPSELADIVSGVFHSIRGLGILESLLADDEITEIMINGTDHIFVEKNGIVIRLDAVFDSEEQLREIIQRIVGQAGREVNESCPIVDTRLPDGSRVNVVLPRVSAVGPVVTIRKFSKEPMNMERLLRLGSITPEVANFLETLVRARYNIFISGDNVIIGLSPSDFRKRGSHGGLVHICLRR